MFAALVLIFIVGIGEVQGQEAPSSAYWVGRFHEHAAEGRPSGFSELVVRQISVFNIPKTIDIRRATHQSSNLASVKLDRASDGLYYKSIAQPAPANTQRISAWIHISAQNIACCDNVKINSDFGNLGHGITNIGDVNFHQGPRNAVRQSAARPINMAYFDARSVGGDEFLTPKLDLLAYEAPLRNPDNRQGTSKESQPKRVVSNGISQGPRADGFTQLTGVLVLFCLLCGLEAFLVSNRRRWDRD